MAGEYITGFKDGHFAKIGNAQHMTMYFFFGLNGVMDILQHYKILRSWSIVYVSYILAYCTEALLFYYQLHGMTKLEILVYMLLFYAVVGCAVSTLCEMKYRSNVMTAICRVYFNMLQGTWFWQVAFILYPPNGNKWDDHNHKQMMIVTIIFTWHNALIFVYLLIMAKVMHHRVKNLKTPPIDNYQSLIDYSSDEKYLKRNFLDEDEMEYNLEIEIDEKV